MIDAELDYLGEERWAQVSDCPGYLVSTHGRVRGKTGRILKYDEDREGYKRVKLYTDNGPKNFKVHRLVAKAFIPNPRRLPEVHHEDNDPGHNCMRNLGWSTRRDNENAKYARYR